MIIGLPNLENVPPSMIDKTILAYAYKIQEFWRTAYHRLAYGIPVNSRAVTIHR